VRKKIGDAEASVLLYYTEFCDSEIRQLWTEHGFEIFCSGFAWGAEHRTVWTYNGGRPKFLHTTLSTLLDHKEVICLQPTTLALYSSSLGIPTSIICEQEISLGLGIVNEGKGTASLRVWDKQISEKSFLLLGNDYAERTISSNKMKLAFKYLGRESFKTPAELERLLPLISGLIPSRLNDI
jgi:hypothetical protein